MRKTFPPLPRPIPQPFAAPSGPPGAPCRMSAAARRVWTARILRRAIEACRAAGEYPTVRIILAEADPEVAALIVAEDRAG